MDTHWLGLFCDTACQQNITAMNHINIVAASVTHIHRNKHLKRNLYICTTVNNTGNKLNNRKLNKKLFLMAQNLIPARSLKFLFYRMEGTVTK